MAVYNPYFPATYQPNFYNNNPYWQGQQQPMMQQQNQQPQSQQQPTIQQSGFILVQSEQDARAYPVAPGNSITFKDETRPYCYVKTMGFSSLDRPVFERYRLVKEDEQPEMAKSAQTVSYATVSELDAVKAEVEAVQAKIETLLAKKVGRPKKEAEAVDDD